MYSLYYFPGTASMVVHLALQGIGAPHELRLVDFDRDEQHADHYLKLNAAGVAPTLLMDSRALNESAALLMVLAERHPNPTFRLRRTRWRPGRSGLCISATR